MLERITSTSPFIITKKGYIVTLSKFYNNLSDY